MSRVTEGVLGPLSLFKYRNSTTKRRVCLVPSVLLLPCGLYHLPLSSDVRVFVAQWGGEEMIEVCRQ